MLINFKVENFRSINKVVELSFVATQDDTYKDELCDFSDINLVKSAIIYGPNGSGKSNVLKSLSFLKLLIVNSIQHQPGTKILQQTFVGKEDEPTNFEINFVIDNVRYKYIVSLISGRVKEENLYYYPNCKQKRIFTRNELNVDSGIDFKNDFKTSLDTIKDNRLFLSCAANFSNNEIILKVFNFFLNNIFVNYFQSENWTNTTINEIKSNKEKKDTFLKILQNLGTGIKDIDIVSKKEKMPDEIKEFLPDAFKKQLAVDENLSIVEVNDVKVVYENFSINLNEESNGIKILFNKILTIVEVISTNSILVIDEIETGLHESIVLNIIQMFKKTKDSKAQLLITTHNTNLMRRNLFRRDQIWFTELTPSRETELYSLVEVKNVRKLENIQNGYISGKYGSIPIITNDFTSFLTGENNEE